MPKTNHTLQTKKLSVLIHQDGLSFYTYDAGEILEQHHEQFKHKANASEILARIQKVFQDIDFLSTAFAKASLLYHHDIFTSVPSTIYESEHAVDYLKYNTRILETDVVSTDQNIGSLALHTVYIAYSNINNYFFDRYGSFEFYHYSSRLLALRDEEPSSLHFEVSLELMATDFYLSIFKNGRLHAHNLFPYQSVEDVLYYTLFTTNQCGADPETFNLRIISEEKNQELFDLLYTYIRHVKFDEHYKRYKQKLVCV